MQGPPRADARHSPIAFRILTLPDFRGEKPAVTDDPATEADLTVEGPDEELCRLLGGRHFLPGAVPHLGWEGGSSQEVTALAIFEA